ncbi:MAG: B12-binding domain-containing radical SAM protein [Nanoarchaeota archaeon]|nr:B12-binding domain-containing radical SAM protein [Nanoarchaeota archaeon]MBU1269241.1 B12-binding domain-containing radical SAM protein [Nanoarchaeota archaeon]MBU1604927.1 B12-binding domain-containing radical SAM protein [Nanoarchaeota archaeon]MBU2443504.1 B12-binding domain-containing radical SAM protein [Nanoarchaeota archaeon]
MGGENDFKNKEISIIGVIPQYPAHSKHNIYARVKMPPVGIISILSQINHNPRFKEVYAIDENNYRGPRDFNGLVDHSFLQQKEPAKIAMLYGGMSNSIPRMFSVAKQYKNFGVTTIAGGSHVDALPEEALRSGIDIVVHSEGEETVQEILKTILKGEEIILNPEELESIKGISLLDKNGQHIFTGKRKPIENLNVLEDPDLTLIKFLEKKWSAIPINRGRGCNYNCEFCVVNNQYGKYKASSVEKTLRQIIKYSDMGYNDFFITDDNFAQDAKQAIKLSKMIGEYKREFNKKIEMTVQVRSEIADDDELIEAMEFAGVKSLAIGYESPINEELRSMKKGVTVEKLVERSSKLSKHFYLHGMFIFGYPTFQDSKHKSTLTLEQRAKAYWKFFKKAKIDTVQMLNAVPLPGSELRAKLETEKRILPLEMVGWDKYDGLFLCYDPTPEGLDAYELQNLPKTLMKKWYLGNFINTSINYGKWINWTYNATIGFPIQFGTFYTKRFFHNLSENRREESMKEEDAPEKNIFYTPLIDTWKDIQKKWRNLFVKTYAGGIVRHWLDEYKKSDYKTKLKEFISKKRMTDNTLTQ